MEKLSVFNSVNRNCCYANNLLFTKLKTSLFRMKKGKSFTIYRLPLTIISYLFSQKFLIIMKRRRRDFVYNVWVKNYCEAQF
jgi:hypothetical protein